jgi:putative membrane protein (TIGR04086 family)
MINRKAIYQGTLVFIVLYAVHLIAVPILLSSIEDAKSSSVLWGIHQFLGIATCLIPGFIAGRIAGERGFFYGFNVGALGTVLSAVAALLWAVIAKSRLPSMATLPFWIMINGFLGAFAGFLATSIDRSGKPA